MARMAPPLTDTARELAAELHPRGIKASECQLWAIWNAVWQRRDLPLNCLHPQKHRLVMHARETAKPVTGRNLGLGGSPTAVRNHDEDPWMAFNG